MKSLSAENTVVYVVSHFPGGGNDRVKKLLWLRNRFAKLVLVTPGSEFLSDNECLIVPPWPNPTGILRVLGLHKAKSIADRYLYLTGMAQLFVKALRKPLLRSISADIQAERSVCLITTAPPHAHGIIGLYVKEKFPEVRWLMDWQDLWSYDENYFLLSPGIYRSRVRRLEQRMLSLADLNITTNIRAEQVLQNLYQVPPEKSDHIHHHFHRPDMTLGQPEHLEANEPRADAPTRIGFMGFLFKPPRVAGDELVNAIGKLRESGMNVELHIHGWIDPKIQSRVLDDSSNGVVFHGRTPHEETVGLLTRYDYLILLLADLPNCRNVMSIKLPHYLIAERPIIAIVPDRSAIADIVRKTGAGVVLPSGSDWENQLRALLADSDPDKLLELRREQDIDAYSWDNVSSDWMRAILGVERRAEPVKEIDAPRLLQMSS